MSCRSTLAERSQAKQLFLLKWAWVASVLSVLLVFGGCTGPDSSTAELYRAPAISNVVDGVVFEAGNWEPHLAAGEEGVFVPK